MSRRAIGLYILLAIVVAACDSGGAVERTTVRIEPEVLATYDGTDCHYDGPEVLTPGRVALNFVNETEAEVWLGWWLLNDDVEYEKFAQQNNPTQGLPMTLIASEKIWYVGGKRPIYVTTGTNALACVLHIGSGISARVTETMDFMSVEVTA